MRRPSGAPYQDVPMLPMAMPCTGDVVELLGVRMRRVPRPGIPPPPMPGDTEPDALGASEGEGARLVRQVFTGIVLLLLGLAFWAGAANGDANPRPGDSISRASPHLRMP